MIQYMKNQIYSPNNYPTNSIGTLTSKIIIKDDYIRADGKCALYLQIFLNKQRKKLNLQVYVNPKNFDKQKQRIKAKETYANDYNLIIEKALADINKIQISYKLGNRNLTMDNLIEEFNNPTARICFVKFWEMELIAQEKIIKASTLKQQASVLNKIKEFRSSILFCEINDDLISEMKQYFKKVKGNSENTLISLIKSFKKYLNIAERKGISIDFKAENIRNKTFKATRTYLSTDEINKLNNYFASEFINKTHRIILGRFLFSCFTGLRISDIEQLTEDHIFNDLIVLTTVKTNKIQRINLNESAKKYLNKEIIFNNQFTPEYINRELKKMAIICGIQKKITFHVARHSFATNFLLQGGRVEVLQKLMGHSKITETMIYVHIADEVANEQMLIMDNILTKKAD